VHQKPHLIKDLSLNKEETWKHDKSPSLLENLFDKDLQAHEQEQDKGLDREKEDLFDTDGLNLEGLGLDSIESIKLINVFSFLNHFLEPTKQDS